MASFATSDALDIIIDEAFNTKLRYSASSVQSRSSRMMRQMRRVRVA